MDQSDLAADPKNFVTQIEDFKRRIENLERLTQSSGVFLNVGEVVGLTIDSGVITVSQTYHSVDTEAGAANDDLDIINGGVEGMILILRATNSTHTVVCKDGVGNLILSGDFSLDHANDTIMLMFDGTNWLQIAESNNV